MPKQQYSIRLDDVILLKLKKIAESERRSFNSQLEYYLDKSIKEYEAQNGEIDVDPDELYK